MAPKTLKAVRQVKYSTVPIKAKFGYGVGHVYNDMVGVFTLSFIAIYTQVGFRLVTSFAGYILFVILLTDALTRPLITVLARNFNICCCFVGTKKSWHILGSLIVTVSVALTYSTSFVPDEKEWIRFLCYAPLFLAFSVGYTCVQVAHKSILKKLTKFKTEKIRLSVWRSVSSLLANITVFVVAAIFIRSYGNTKSKAFTTGDEIIIRNISFFVMAAGILFCVIFYVLVPEVPPSSCREAFSKCRDRSTGSSDGACCVSFVFCACCSSVNVVRPTRTIVTSNLLLTSSTVTEKRHGNLSPVQSTSGRQISMKSEAKKIQQINKFQKAIQHDKDKSKKSKLSVKDISSASKSSSNLPVITITNERQRKISPKAEGAARKDSNRLNPKIVIKSPSASSVSLPSSLGQSRKESLSRNNDQQEKTKKIFCCCHRIKIVCRQCSLAKMKNSVKDYVCCKCCGCNWFHGLCKKPKFYKTVVIHACSRLALVVTQVFMPLYLTETLLMDKISVAIIPLIIYIVGFLTSLVIQRVTLKYGRKASFAIGEACTVAACIWMFFLTPTTQNQIYPAAVLLGLGLSTLHIRSVSMMADMTGSPVDSGASVFGVNEKVIQAIAILIIQILSPCSQGTREECTEFYRNIMLTMPGGSTFLAFAVLSIAKILGLEANEKEEEREATTTEKVTEMPGI